MLHTNPPALKIAVSPTQSPLSLMAAAASHPEQQALLLRPTIPPPALAALLHAAAQHRPPQTFHAQQSATVSRSTSSSHGSTGTAITLFVNMKYAIIKGRGSSFRSIFSSASSAAARCRWALSLSACCRRRRTCAGCYENTVNDGANALPCEARRIVPWEGREVLPLLLFHFLLFLLLLLLPLLLLLQQLSPAHAASACDARHRALPVIEERRRMRQVGRP